MIQLSCPFLLPYITHIINFCFEHSVFPKQWKEGRVTPIPKIDSPKEIKDLRPITVLPALSKVIERMIEGQLRNHLIKFDSLPLNQSGFRPGHSCGTALLNITDDIIQELDKKNVGALILLDYTKAFDMINHDILVAILHFIGLSQSAIMLFENYLNNRTQKVILCEETSESYNTARGVAQGSILGPLLYTVYTCNLPTTLNTCRYHMYADDTQLYHFFDRINIAAECQNINNDLEALVNLSLQHNLKINASKSSVIFFGDIPEKDMLIELGGEKLEVTSNAKNLGVFIDNQLRFTDHVSYLLKKSLW